MTTREDLDLLIKRRQELDTVSRRLLPSELRQAEIEMHKAEFIKNGGKIIPIPNGVSGVSRDNLTLREAKEFEIKRQMAINTNVARSRKPQSPTELTYGTFLGAQCPKCGNAKRYLSNADCVVCAKERRERNAATMKHNTRRRDAKAD